MSGNRTWPSLLAVVFAAPAWAGTLVVLNKAESTASLIDLDTMQVAGTVKTGIGPHEVAVSSDGTLAVVANYGGDVAGHSLTVIELPSGAVQSTIDLGEYVHPHGIAFVGEGREVVVTSEDRRCVVRVDLAARKVAQVLPTEQAISHMVVVEPGAARAFVANIGAGSVTVLDLVRGKKVRDVRTGKGAEGLDYNSRTRELWVANRGEDSIAVVDSGTLKIKQVLKADAFPIRVKFTPDQSRALVTNAQAGTLTIFNALTKQQEKAIAFPKGNMDTAGKMFGDRFKDSSVPIGIALDPGQGRAFVAHASLDQISIVDLQRLEVTGSLQAGREPDGMAYSPRSISK